MYIIKKKIPMDIDLEVILPFNLTFKIINNLHIKQKISVWVDESKI